ncbi:autotransporter assembly complex protein TamA [Polymorphum gilvum]|uniref:Outer membrane protein, OMP85 family, putative n=1 Tax=Polymorphum gilvum (strain LMG 25793 / CGMCC 1.9160 / SL003B-26A1) TaxID=991905 RepID=F2J5W4_POLGS|nr:autotransporter assembly complex family protein [Polymorphum gilvum]ADZ71218.1 Outer membrane protein, OMP85 family, putative [Polymorphum gilvum SL003B-26A1]
MRLPSFRSGRPLAGRPRRPAPTGAARRTGGVCADGPHSGGASSGGFSAAGLYARAPHAVVLALALATWSASAQGFELFGFTLFGAETPAETVPDALPYAPTLTLAGGDDDLKALLEETSLLVGETDNPPSGEAGLISRALNDLDRLVARLYTAGRYGGTVDIRLGGVPLQRALDSGDIPDARPVPVTIAVDAGPIFRFGAVRIETRGAAAGAISTDPAFWGLAPGAAADSVKILDAERQIVTLLRGRGYPKARIAERVIVADHASNTLDVTLSATAGEQARFGPVAVAGTEVTDPDFVAVQAMIPEGETYDPEVLARAQKRLNDLGIFASVRFVEGDTVGPDGRLPITIEVSERKRHVIGAGATWSSTEGIGLEAYWRRRNLFGRGELLSVEGSVGRLGNTELGDMEYAGRIAFEKPGVFGPLTRFTTSLGAKQETPDAYTSRSVTADAYLRREFTDQIRGRAGVEAYYADEQDVYGNHTYFLVGVPGELSFDSRDDPLNPTEGVFASLFGEPAYDIRGKSNMLFLKGTASTYAALDDAARFVLAGKASVGSILGASIQDVPASRRFIAGGGGSIRGYAYRNVGPRLNGEVTGGLSLIELSGEVRVKATETIGIVGFVDAGNAYADSVPDLSRPLKIGVGAGLRYFTPIGPLRLDVAVPLSPEKDDPDFALYVGLSQAF